MHALQNKRINTKRYLRKGQRQQSAEEKKKGEGEEKRRKRGRGEREISVRFSRTRVCARAFQPQCCFLLSQVSHRGRKIGVNSIEK